MRWNDQYEEVAGLFADDRSDYEIARITGVPRSTVRRWRHAVPGQRQRRRLDRPRWSAEREPAAYCYLLGLYLGDGNVHQKGRAALLRLTMDGQYPGLIDEAMRALEAVFRPPSIGRYVKGGGAWVVLQVCTPDVLTAFPQHGPGHKHTRQIELSGWQRDLTHAYPGALVRGLIHSDGCRTVNRFKTKLPSGRVRQYEYPRYFFSNLSGDIREILCAHCELLGVHWTQSNPRNISVSRRDSVAILDEVVGPKR